MRWWKFFGDDGLARQAAAIASTIAQELATATWRPNHASVLGMSSDEARGYFRAKLRGPIAGEVRGRHLAEPLSAMVHELALDEAVERLVARLRQAQALRGREAA